MEVGYQLMFTQPFRGIQINHTHPLARGLIGSWPFNDGTGPKTWDYSGNANKGTLEGGATWTPGRRGWAVNCDGVDGRIDCGNGAPLDDLGNGSFWLSFRMKSKDAVPLVNSYIFNKFQGATDYLILYSSGTANRLAWTMRKGAAVIASAFSVDSAPFDTVFNHIILVCNRTTDRMLLYVNTIKDSVEIDISSMPADISNTANLSWGARHDGISPYEGLIGNCLVGKGILSQEEINWLYREPYAMFYVPGTSRFLIALVTGKLNIAFTEKKPSIAFTEKKPSIAFTEKKPSIAFTGE